MTPIYQIIIKPPCIPVFWGILYPFFIVTPWILLCKLVNWNTLHFYLLGRPVFLFIWTPCIPIYLDALYSFLFGHPVPLFIKTPCTPTYWDTLYPYLLGHPVPLFIGTPCTPFYWDTLNPYLFWTSPWFCLLGNPYLWEHPVILFTPRNHNYWDTLYSCF